MPEYLKNPLNIETFSIKIKKIDKNK